MSRGANGLDVILFLVTYLMYAWQVSRFLRICLHGKPSEGKIFGGLLFGSHAVMAVFLEKQGIPYILYAVGGHGIFVGLTMTVFKGGRERKLLAAVTGVVMIQLIWNFSDSLLCCLGLILVRVLTGSPGAVSVGVWGERIISFMTCVAGTTAVSLLSKPLEPVFAGKRKSWYLYVTVPLSGIALMTDLVNWAASNGILVQGPGKYGLLENQLFSHGAICVFTGLAMAAAGFLVFGMDRIERQERAGEQYRSQVLYYEMMEEQYSRMECLRHDMKNHFIALDNLIQNRQWESASSYLGEMAESGGVEAGDEVTGSLVIDAVLYHKRRQAKDHGIRWQCEARLPADCPVKEIDLCIIVGNALDNGLEACQRLSEKGRSFIQVYLGTIKKCLFLEVRNSADLEEKPAGTRTWKDNPGEHGLGLGNIKAAAAEYNGAVSTDMKDGVFTVSVLLPLYPLGEGGGSERM